MKKLSTSLHDLCIVKPKACFLIFSLQLIFSVSYGQKGLLKLEERLYGSQYFQSYQEVKYYVKDSLEREIGNIDITTVPRNLSFQIKFFDLTPDGTINDQNVADQIEVLNNAFNNISVDRFIQNENLNSFYSLAAVPSFKFCSDGIIERFDDSQAIPVNKNTIDNLFARLPGGLNENQIPVFIVELSDKFAGISTHPMNYPKLDGIVIDHRFFSLKDSTEFNYTGGKTLVHLIANYFGLEDLWNEFEPCGDDKVSDTPIHNYANFTIGTNYKNVSTCEGQPVEMIVNYMDNTPDEYQCMFTEGQVERMRKIAFSKWGRKNKINLSCEFEASIREGKVEYNLFPNPNAGQFNLVPSKTMNEVEASVFDVFGNKVWHQNYFAISNHTGIFLDISNQPNGVYFVRIQSKDEENVIKKVVKN